MFKTQELEKSIIFLKESAIKRNTNQGVKLYGHYLLLLEKNIKEQEFNEILNEVKNLLGSLDAHGYFTDEEYECVTSIRNIKEF